MFTLVVSLALAQDPAPTGQVVAVTVFQDRATVTREVSVDLTAGSNRVVFRDLPPNLDDRTVQAEGASTVGASIRGIEVIRRELAEDRRARVEALRDRRTALQDQRQEHVDRKTSAETELTFLERVGAAAAAQLSAELLFAPDTTTDARNLADLLRARVPEIRTTIREAGQAIRDVDAEIGAVDRELAAVQGAPQWARRDVTVDVDAPTAGRATVKLTYTLPGASWTPTWDVRATPGSPTVALSLSAQVTQTTGEDWSNVGLTLSTARPAGGVSPPVLDPFWLQPPYVDYGTFGGLMMDAEPVMAAESEESGGGRFRERAAAGPPPPPPEAPMAVLQATVEERAVASTFVVPGGTSIPGDGARRRVKVTEASPAATWVHVAVPSLDERAFVVSELTWSESWPLLAGPASIFVGDAFVGAMDLPTIGQGGTVEVGFGPDDAVRVTRTTVEDLRKGPNFFGKIKVTRLYSATVESGRSEPVQVSIREVLPISTVDAWKVKPIGDEPDRTEDEGRIFYDRTVAAGAPVTVSTGYQLRFPRKNPPGGY